MSELKLTRCGRVVVVTLNRPAALNALNGAMMVRLVNELRSLDADPGVGCIVITGDKRSFAAGADISELAACDYRDVVEQNLLAGWQEFAQLRTPKVAAVSGFALGGGCELAMMCDVIYAADNARFGQPEIKLGLIPGMGGSQRLSRLVGRTKAMDMILTGRMIDAAEADRIGLVARVYPLEGFVDAVLENAQVIANFAKSAAVAAREAVCISEESGLSEGLLFERRTYHSMWATADAHEGMQAFLEKREAVFSHQKDEYSASKPST